MNLLNRKYAFTLVELLVVVAVIALLISIIIPSLGRAKESAHITQCLSQLKQLGTALNLYMNDNDDRLPPLVLESGTWPTWDEELFTYLGEEEKVLLCPSDPIVNPSIGSNRTYAANGGVKYTGGDYPFGNSSQPPYKRYHLDGHGSRLILIGERPGDTPTNRGFIGKPEYGSLDQIPSTIHRKGEGGNYLWSDLSASFAPVSDVMLKGNQDVWYIPVN